MLVTKIGQIVQKRLAILIVFMVHISVEAKITLAVSNATTGPAAELGKDLNQGAELYFSQLDQLDVLLLKKDDGYEPQRALHHTRQFAADSFSLLFNYLGTPTTKAVLNVVKAKRMSLITPFTGADFLRDARATGVFNLRASYRQEATFQVDYLVRQLGVNKIGLVIQADDFGIAFERYFTQALQYQGLQPKFISRYRRNSNDVMRAVAQAKRADIQALVFIGTYQPMATMVNQVYPESPNLIFASASFVSSDQLVRRIPEKVKLLVTEVVPNPVECRYRECEEFVTLAAQQKTHINHGVFEGYLNAKWLASALLACVPQVSQLCVEEKLTQQAVLLLGEQRQFNVGNRQLIDDVFATLRNLPAPSSQQSQDK
jgi:ABC-type branched-subunit amino acid transport system substrate-binding protein